MTILIPAYEPDKRLLQLIQELQQHLGYPILIVDDGSGPDFASIFRQAKAMGCTVLAYEENKGKGHALKIGFNHLLRQGEKDGVVTADSDGQHLPRDIAAVAAEVQTHPSQVILGTRRFTGAVPWRNRTGNAITRTVFALASGKKIYDTQTGLRGFSADLLPWLLEIKGERFDFEMNMLLDCVSEEVPVFEKTIQTVYEPKGKYTTHFRPFWDSIQVYWPLVTFCLSSLTAGLIDMVLVLGIKALTGNLLAAVVFARICSSLTNYAINKKVVFSSKRVTSVRQTLIRYTILACIIMACSYGLLHLMTDVWGISLFVSKLVSDNLLFIASYWIQRKYVFK